MAVTSSLLSFSSITRGFMGSRCFAHCACGAHVRLYRGCNVDSVEVVEDMCKVRERVRRV